MLQRRGPSSVVKILHPQLLGAIPLPPRHPSPVALPAPGLSGLNAIFRTHMPIESTADPDFAAPFGKWSLLSSATWRLRPPITTLFAHTPGLSLLPAAVLTPPPLRSVSHLPFVVSHVKASFHLWQNRECLPLRAKAFGSCPGASDPSQSPLKPL